MVRVRGAAVAGHLHPELSAIQHGPVHGVHGVFSVSFVVETDESESSAFFSVTIPGDVNVANAAVFLENPPECIGGRPVRQVIYLEGRHALHVWRRAPVAHGGLEPPEGRRRLRRRNPKEKEEKLEAARPYEGGGAPERRPSRVQKGGELQGIGKNRRVLGRERRSRAPTFGLCGKG